MARTACTILYSGVKGISVLLAEVRANQAHGHYTLRAPSETCYNFTNGQNWRSEAKPVCYNTKGVRPSSFEFHCSSRAPEVESLNVGQRQQ